LAQPAAQRSASSAGSLEALRDRSRASTRRPRCAAFAAPPPRRTRADLLPHRPALRV